MTSFRIWNSTTNKYQTEIDKHITVTFDKLTNAFTITTNQPHMTIEPHIAKHDINNTPIHIGDVLTKTETHYITTDDHERIDQLKKTHEILHIKKLDHAPWGFPKDEKYSIVYTKTNQHSTPSTNATHPIWLNGETFGYEGEGLEDPTEWMIVGNIHDDKWRHIAERKQHEPYDKQ